MLLLGLGAVGGEGAALAKISATGTFKIEKNMSTLTNSLEWKPNKCQGGAPFFAVNILITCGEPNPVEIPYNIS